MSTQLETKQRTLAQMLAANKLTKIASDQTVKHMSVYGQKSLGKEQTGEINENIEGVLASTPAAANKEQSSVDTPPNCQNLNTTAEGALSRTGTSVNIMDPQGNVIKMPKSASFYRQQLAGILSGLKKQAACEEDMPTCTETLVKHAAFQQSGSREDYDDFINAVVKTASMNPVFQAHYNNILMHKLAEDVKALAEAEGIPEDQAAEVMDQAAEQHPEIEQNAKDEAAAEALQDVADAEQEADAVNGELQALADNASANLGTEVSADDIADALQTVQEQADQLGVSPEELISTAVDELQAGEDTDPEAEAEAQAILDEAAANGVSPEEVISMAADNLEDDGENVKEASYQLNDRVNFVRSLLR